MYIVDRKTMTNAEISADARGVSFYTLMENAGCAAADYIFENTDFSGKNALILCGNGNNGGDGFVVARELAKRGVKTYLTLVSGEPKTDCAKRAFKTLGSEVTVITADALMRSCYGEEDDLDYDFYSSVFIDAVYGTGFRGELPQEIGKLFGLVEVSDYALDIPSGVICDSAEVSEGALRTERTISFAAVKKCHVLPPSADHCGKLVCLPIGIDEEDLESAGAKIRVISPKAMEKRPKSAHKNSMGVCLAVTGSYGMPGAAIISAKAALRSGIGILKLACVEENYTAMAVSLPEAVLVPLKSNGKTFSAEGIPALKEQLKDADSLLIGCGLGISEDAEKIVKELLLSARVPVVLDADGINLIARDIEFIKNVKAPLILTPHPGEMARLLGTTAAEVEKNRLEAAKSFAEKYQLTLVLKGANTIVAHPEHGVSVNLIGNAGMSSAGSGDMLAGIIAAIAARWKNAPLAALQGVWLHSAAGDLTASELGENFMLPTDMIERLSGLTAYDEFFGKEIYPLP